MAIGLPGANKKVEKARDAFENVVERCSSGVLASAEEKVKANRLETNAAFVLVDRRNDDTKKEIATVFITTCDCAD